MISRLIRLVYSLIGTAVIIFVCSIGWVVIDGSRDGGGRAEAALVPSHAGTDYDVAWDTVKIRLDRAIDLYKANIFSAIVVSGSTQEGDDIAGKMVQYLEAQGVPSSAITGDLEKVDTQQQAKHWASIIKEKNFGSVMIVTDYYQITRLKLALKQETDVQMTQAHVGSLQFSDLFKISCDVVDMYKYIFKLWLAPAAAEASDKIKSEAQKAKETIDKKIDSLPK